jgi:hypothetical protein
MTAAVRQRRDRVVRTVSPQINREVLTSLLSDVVTEAFKVVAPKLVMRPSTS